MGFTAWASIEGLHNLVKTFKRTGISPKVTYAAKVKLHGTNAGIRVSPDGTVTAQSRSQDISINNDNAGFAAWVQQNRDEWSKLATSTEIIVFGEWAGSRIMKGTSISEIGRRIFAVFAIYIDGPEPQVITSPISINLRLAFAGVDVADLFVLPWLLADGKVSPETEDDDTPVLYLTCDYGDKASVQAMADRVNAEVLKVERCDPWVQSIFGVEGTGEGLVLYPLEVDGVSCHPTSRAEALYTYMYKAKGEEHRVKASKQAVTVDTETVASVSEFVAAFVTNARCEQGAAACGGIYDPKQTGNFLKWMATDVLKESVAELEESGLTWSQVQKAVGDAARKWYIERCKQI